MRIKRDTRHFAKRQLTWFRREQEVIWVNKNEFDYKEERILEFMLAVLRRKGILAVPQAGEVSDRERKRLHDTELFE